MKLTEYAQRMNKVLDHIDRHLGEPLELDMLADVAHFSRYHFHRVFSAWVGETFGDYLRRRRLEFAALRLAAHPDAPVLEVALSVGFGSGEAFARAFKSRFGCTPSAWREDTPRRQAATLEAVRNRRQQSNPDQADSNLDQAILAAAWDNDGFIDARKEPPMQVEIVELPPVKIAYMRQIGPYGPAIGEFWDKAFTPWLVANGLLGEPCYGIGHDDPSITPPDKCRYDACVEVPADFVPSGRAVNLGSLPGGRYAVARFYGNPQSIGDVWIELYRDWLPRSGFQCDVRPCFEYYPRNWKPDPATGQFGCDLCMPLVTA